MIDVVDCHFSELCNRLRFYLEKFFIPELYNRYALFADESVLSGVLAEWE
jgi:hypothetical protein